MWTSVVASEIDSAVPSARSKHSATLVGEHVYLLGGRNGNLPMKDFWKYNLVTGKWQQIKPNGYKLPCLQEHTAVAYKDHLYVFGGEVGFSAGTETPLWAYDIKTNCWRKIRARKGVSTPKGRRGHTALVHKGTMLIYGGYQDLRGSCGELWAYHFDTESWHLVSAGPAKFGVDTHPPARHKHSAILHNNSMWVYGGMTDLQERSDLWKWDAHSGAWTNIKTKTSPGPLHSHVACRLPSCMVVFGGEKEGQMVNDLWRFNFGTELWEKVNGNGLKPHPRSESVAFSVSELVLQRKGSFSLEIKSTRTRQRICNSADRSSKQMNTHLSSNKVSPCEQTYVFRPSTNNYVDGSGDSSNAQTGEAKRLCNSKGGFLQEISKLSQLNIMKANTRCSYTVLSGNHTDSTENLLNRTSPGVENEDFTTSTPTRATMIKSKSAYAFKKPDDVPQQKKRVEFDCVSKKIPREPISVPNFSLLTLPTPVLTPVEATKLVFLDTEEENYHYDDEFALPYTLHAMKVKTASIENELEFKPIMRGDSYNSHLAYTDNPLYEHTVGSSNSSKLEKQSAQDGYDENVSSTSDYYSLETVNRLSSSSSYSVRATGSDEKPKVKAKGRDDSFGFCNPNYMSPEIKSGGRCGKAEFHHVINSGSFHDREASDDEDILELQNYNNTFSRNTKVYYRQSNRNSRPPSKPVDVHNESLRLKGGKWRASSAGRVEKNRGEVSKREGEVGVGGGVVIPLYVFLFGGKELGQVTVFQRPLSIWKLKL